MKKTGPQYSILHQLWFIIMVICGLSNLYNLKAQSVVNLVPNPGFETFTTCPTDLAQITTAASWESFCYSPDYFNACSKDTYVDVPRNAIGTQHPYEGNGYAGFVAYWPGILYREYIGIKLSEPLQINQTYYCSMKVSLAERWFYNDTAYFTACNKIGMKFTNTHHNKNNCVPLTNTAQVFTNVIISDTAAWTNISGSFMADSAYKYLVIGNFFDNAQTDTLRRFPNTAEAYYFVDWVAVSTNSLVLQAQIRKSQMDVPLINLYPNPASAELFIRTNEEQDNLKIELSDVTGRLLFSNTLKEEELQKISLNIPPGLYEVRIRKNHGELVVRKTLIVENYDE